MRNLNGGNGKINLTSRTTTNTKMSSSAICQNFVQNAWKKELCSNCFKSRDEHTEKSKPKPVQLIPSKNVQGIIRNGERFRPKRTVCFQKDLIEVIGVGGEDWDLEAEDEAHDAIDDPIVDTDEDEDDEEERKELRKITKENTNFNTTALKENHIESKKNYNLLLGKPVVDSAGRKQTLLVTVTPFGEDVISPRKITKMSHIPISKVGKESLAETKTNVILKSYTKNEENCGNEEKSLLDEITETLENSKNPIQIISRKKTGVADKENILENGTDEKTAPKLNGIEKKIALTRTPALKRDQEKPIIYQTSTAKIDLLNNKNAKLNKTKPENIRIEGKTEEHGDKLKNEPQQMDDKPALVLPKLQSREQAGEPDGRADPDAPNEPPALPLTPPPHIETQTSFLHNSQHSPVYDKPKVPSKPATVLIRKPVNPIAHFEAKNQVMTTFGCSDERKPPTKPDIDHYELVKLAANKRKAPKPPEEIYCHTSLPIDPTDRKERASSCSPKIREDVADGDTIDAPEPAPRKLLSVSTDNLIANDEKRKEKSHKARFSLKKFLRMGGSTKDISKTCNETTTKLDDVVHIEPCPQPKPRLVIVHPSELNGAQVEVVSTAMQPDPGDYEPLVAKVTATKPPPPPRKLDERNPHVPHPPKSADILHKQKQYNRNGLALRKDESVYANIGEVRSAITPHKPQRTASMREREAQQRSNYEPVQTENVYDYISGRSSSPDSDSGPSKHNSPKCKTGKLQKRSESSCDVSGEYFKYNNIPRSMSLTYCGSETESEIYAPYGFYGSESEVTEDDHDWIQNGRTHKLRSRKGRSIVHKNLEDNYGAVVVANHEALAQVLENIQQTVHIQPALRGLKTLSNLRWSDFTLKPGIQGVIFGRRIFHQGLWGAQNVTLVITAGTTPSSTLSLGTFNLVPITEFSDLVPGKYLPNENDETKLIQATIGVLSWFQINSIQSYGEILKTKNPQNRDETAKETLFVLLQFINALKTLQAQGIEELPLNLSSFVLCKDMEKDTQQKLSVLQGFGEEIAKNDNEKYGTLCMCACRALNALHTTCKISPLIRSLLDNERAVSLTQVKSVLEFSLWGPSDVALGSTIKERELALQRWFDLQRATVLHGLVCTRIQLTIYEQCHLMFLVRSNSRMMCDASLLLESNHLKNGHK